MVEHVHAPIVVLALNNVNFLLGAQPHSVGRSHRGRMARPEQVVRPQGGATRFETRSVTGFETQHGPWNTLA